MTTVFFFYSDLLGCRLDNDTDGTTVHCGDSQLKLVYTDGDNNDAPKPIIGLAYLSLDGVKRRLQQLDDTSPRIDSQIGVDETSGREYVRLVDPSGNVFYCRTATSSQPDPADCCGIAYVEFPCPPGTADQIALFYESVLDATTSVLMNGKIAIIAVGNIDQRGRADQSLLFRETAHANQNVSTQLAIHVGESAADFVQAYRNAEMAGIVWVDSESDKRTGSLQGARKCKQFCFRDIVEMQTGKKILELEHQIRSVEHETFPRRLSQT